jgi:hypothetical protein
MNGNERDEITTMNPSLSRWEKELSLRRRSVPSVRLIGLVWCANEKEGRWSHSSTWASDLDRPR